jgi:hypothetical protein
LTRGWDLFGVACGALIRDGKRILNRTAGSEWAHTPPSQIYLPFGLESDGKNNWTWFPKKNIIKTNNLVF